MTVEMLNCDCLDYIKTLEDKSQHLIIVDPPYFEVKGEFDFIWATFEDYLEDVEKWAIECKRLLADNGTLLWWGHAKKIAYSQIILDKYFNLENSLVWEKRECQTKRTDFEQSRVFAPITERVLMYSNEWDFNSLDEIMFNKLHFKNIKDYLRSQKQKTMVKFNFSSKQFNDYTLSLGCSTTPYKNWFCNTSFWEMATEKNYNLLQKSGYFQKPYEELRKEYDELRKEYEELRKEYEELRRPFNNTLKLTDVLKFSQESSVTGKYKHPTQKAPKLCRALINTCSRKGQNLLVPFIGSGVECIEGFNAGLNVRGTELDKNYYNDACKRFAKETRQQKLF